MKSICCVNEYMCGTETSLTKRGTIYNSVDTTNTIALRNAQQAHKVISILCRPAACLVTSVRFQKYCFNKEKTQVARSAEFG